jgi:hypothetical protein
LSHEHILVLQLPKKVHVEEELVYLSSHPNATLLPPKILEMVKFVAKTMDHVPQFMIHHLDHVTFYKRDNFLEGIQYYNGVPYLYMSRNENAFSLSNVSKTDFCHSIKNKESIVVTHRLTDHDEYMTSDSQQRVLNRLINADIFEWIMAFLTNPSIWLDVFIILIENMDLLLQRIVNKFI